MEWAGNKSPQGCKSSWRKASFRSWLQVPSVLSLSDEGTWGIWTYSMHVVGTREDPAYVRASLYLNTAFFSWLWPLHTNRTTIPGTVFFQSPSWEGLQNSFHPRIPKSPWEISISSPSLLFLPHLGFNSYSHLTSLVFLCLSHQVTSPSPDRVCFILLCLVAPCRTGNHHTPLSSIHPPYSMVISVNYNLVFSFVLQILSSLNKAWLLQMKILAFTSVFPEMSFKGRFGEAQHWLLCSWLVTTAFPLKQETPSASVGGSRNYWEREIYPIIF